MSTGFHRIVTSYDPDIIAVKVIQVGNDDGFHRSIRGSDSDIERVVDRLCRR